MQATEDRLLRWDLNNEEEATFHLESGKYRVYNSFHFEAVSLISPLEL